jgi:hypothetical protein
MYTVAADAGHEAVFLAVEASLREHYQGHILPPSQKEWIFINAGAVPHTSKSSH